MKRNFICFFLLLFQVVFLFADQITMSISDLVVESNNSAYEFLGKGISRLIASEIRKSGKVKLIEREAMNKVLKEQAFSVSDLADQEKQIRIGMLLSARYMVMGEIIDMGEVLLFSLRMVNVETGEIVWIDELKDKLAAYDYISSYLAKSLLASIGIDAEKTTLVKIEKKEEKKADAIVKLSGGIDAYDKNDTTAAKKELEAAKALDPANEVAREFLSKIESVSPKFRVETELYAPAYNPASLGFIDRDLAYSWMSMLFNPPWVTPRPDIAEDQLTGEDYWASNFGFPVKVGYMLPVLDNLGVGVEMITGGYRWLAARVDGTQFDYNGIQAEEVKFSFNNFGGAINLGIQPVKNIGLGAAFMLWNTSRGPGETIYVKEGMSWAAGGGVMLKVLEDSLTVDASVMYTNQGMYYAGAADLKMLDGSMPLLAEASATYALVDRILYAGLKGIGNIYLDDRKGYALRIIPIVEYQPFPFLFFRGGYEYSRFDQAGMLTPGHGFLGGITLKIGKIELSGNFTYSVMPARLLPGYTVKNFTLLIGAAYTSGLFVR